MWNCQKYQIFGSFLFATNFLSASGDFCCNSVLFTKIFFFLLDRFPVNNFWVNSYATQLHKRKCSAKVKLFGTGLCYEKTYTRWSVSPWKVGSCSKIEQLQSQQTMWSTAYWLVSTYWYWYFKYGSIKGSRSVVIFSAGSRPRDKGGGGGGQLDP